MNKMLKTAILATATLGFVAAPVLADKAAEKAVGARKAQMQLYAFNISQLGAMAKGAVEYNAEAAKAAAENLAALAALNGGPMWMQGTDSTAMPGVSRAKLETWTTYPKASNIGKALAEDSAKLAAVAGNGLDALRGGIGPVGKSCKACHEGYREEKKE